MKYLTEKRKYEITYLTKDGVFSETFICNGIELNLKILDGFRRNREILEIKEKENN